MSMVRGTYKTHRVKAWGRPHMDVVTCRRIGNDSGPTAARTLDLLRRCEPHVGYWTGDTFGLEDRKEDT